MNKRKIYVASSWRNIYQASVVGLLREEGHEVYDFKEPVEGEKGFGWHEIDPNWQYMAPEQFKKALQHPIAQHGYKRDRDAVNWCDTGVLVLPCGMSAHTEIGRIDGQGKPVAIYMPELREPELMYNFFTEKTFDSICLTPEELVSYLRGL